MEIKQNKLLYFLSKNTFANRNQLIDIENPKIESPYSIHADFRSELIASEYYTIIFLITLFHHFMTCPRPGGKIRLDRLVGHLVVKSRAFFLPP
jgi:hypothetical protein